MGNWLREIKLYVTMFWIVRVQMSTNITILYKYNTIQYVVNIALQFYTNVLSHTIHAVVFARQTSFCPNYLTLCGKLSFVEVCASVYPECSGRLPPGSADHAVNWTNILRSLGFTKAMATGAALKGSNFLAIFGGLTWIPLKTLKMSNRGKQCCLDPSLRQLASAAIMR